MAEVERPWGSVEQFDEARSVTGVAKLGEDERVVEGSIHVCSRGWLVRRGEGCAAHPQTAEEKKARPTKRARHLEMASQSVRG